MPLLRKDANELWSESQCILQIIFCSWQINTLTSSRCFWRLFRASVALLNCFSVTLIVNPKGFCNSLKKGKKKWAILQTLERKYVWLDLAHYKVPGNVLFLRDALPKLCYFTPGENLCHSLVSLVLSQIKLVLMGGQSLRCLCGLHSGRSKVAAAAGSWLLLLLQDLAEPELELLRLGPLSVLGSSLCSMPGSQQPGFREILFLRQNAEKLPWLIILLRFQMHLNPQSGGKILQVL